jgi:DNA repair protein RadD
MDASTEALATHKNTLLVAPTGAGKTIMLSAITGRRIAETPKGQPSKGLILQHRDELVSQNTEKFRKINPTLPVSLYVADSKSWGGRAVFAMVQTLARNLDTIPKLGTLTVDEAHHATSPSYRAIINKAREVNPDVAILGVTATPNRGDGTPMREVFDNVADQISIGELIASGHLVRPRTFVLDVGVTDDLMQVRKLASDFDMGQVAKIMDREVVTDQIVKLWANGDAARNLPACRTRPTIVFCSTVAHAHHVAASFREFGHSAAVIHGSMSSHDRALVLNDFKRGRVSVLVNVAVLTEGFDYPPTSCVILLRPSSYKSTMTQMVGRGLRVVDANEYPGVVKTDCIVLDFGTASLTHGSLEEEANLDGNPHAGEAPTKECPNCGGKVPIAVMECPLCGHQWERQEKHKNLLTEVVLTEIDLLNKSNFQWIDIWHDNHALIACGFEAWAGLFWWGGVWHAIGGTQDEMRHLGVSDRLVALAIADDYLNSHEDESSAHKAKRWLREPATQRQLQVLGLPPTDISTTKYQATCMLCFRVNKRGIYGLVTEQHEEMKAA